MLISFANALLRDYKVSPTLIDNLKQAYETSTKAMEVFIFRHVCADIRFYPLDLNIPIFSPATTVRYFDPSTVW